jgi:chorismate synthase
MPITPVPSAIRDTATRAAAVIFPGGLPRRWCLRGPRQARPARRGISVSAEISNVGGVCNPTPEQLEKAILAAGGEGDSVGGVIRCTVQGLPAGLGEPDFGRNAEGIFSQHLFAVPAVKGVAFGAGFRFAFMKGSQANDPFYMDAGAVRTRTNHAGGINGGITNGMPVVFEAVFRPTPSISKTTAYRRFDNGQDTELVIRGRHDPCILPPRGGCDRGGGGAGELPAARTVRSVTV